MVVDVQQARDQPQVPATGACRARVHSSPHSISADACLTCRARRSAPRRRRRRRGRPAQPGRRRAALAPSGRGRPGGREGWSAPCRRLSACRYLSSERSHSSAACRAPQWMGAPAGRQAVATRPAGGQNSAQAAEPNRSGADDSAVIGQHGGGLVERSKRGVSHETCPRRRPPREPALAYAAGQPPGNRAPGRHAEQLGVPDSYALDQQPEPVLEAGVAEPPGPASRRRQWRRRLGRPRPAPAAWCRARGRRSWPRWRSTARPIT